jgi:hypothetical protein
MEVSTPETSQVRNRSIFPIFDVGDGLRRLVEKVIVG